MEILAVRCIGAAGTYIAVMKPVSTATAGETHTQLGKSGKLSAPV